MAHPKRNLLAFIGWIVIKLLALIGLPFAKRKLEDQQHKRHGLLHRK